MALQEYKVRAGSRFGNVHETTMLLSDADAEAAGLTKADLVPARQRAVKPADIDFSEEEAEAERLAELIREEEAARVAAGAPAGTPAGAKPAAASESSPAA